MNAGRTVFSQLIEFLPHQEFQKCVARYAGNRYLKNLSCWDQYLAMAFAQLTYRESLRDIEACLRSVGAKLYHMGFRGKVARSTLADANESRDWRIYADFAQVLIAIARPLYARDPIGIDLDQSLYALDSTTIDLCLSLFPWAKFRKHKAAVKMHTLLDLHGNIPTFIRITDGQVHDVNLLNEIMPEPGAFYVMDRGYIDFQRLFVFTLSAAFFVVRTKSNVLLQRRYSHAVDKSTGIRSDQTVILTSFESASAYPDALRRVSYFDAETNKRLWLASGTVLRELDMVHSFVCHGISRSSCLESSVGGVVARSRSALHCSTSALHIIHGAPGQACVAGSCFNRIIRKIVVGVTPRTLDASPTNISPRASRSPSR